MLTTIIRIALVLFNIAASIYFYSKEDYISMFMLLMASLLFIYAYFKYGTVYIAFQQLKKNNLKKAEVLILKIKNPDKLAKSHKPYYYFITGIIALEKSKLEQSHSDLNKALEIGLRTENDLSIVLLNLANIELLRCNYDSAKAYIKKVRALHLKPLINKETNRIEKEINLAQPFR